LVLIAACGIEQAIVACETEWELRSSSITFVTFFVPCFCGTFGHASSLFNIYYGFLISII
jgi:hypothetical protein